MNAYKKQLINSAAQKIANKLNIENSNNNLFVNIAAMMCDTVVNSTNLNVWAATTLDYALMDDDTDAISDNLTFTDVLFISENAEIVVQYLQQ